MDEQGLAVHRTIVAVDVEGFGNLHRTNRNQVAVRDGLYRAMQEACHQAGIPWADLDHEDRGDGMFILVSPGVPKSLFVESLPPALVRTLRRHNSVHPESERIRLRMALHAGEVNYDEHGATSASINLTFRLLEAQPLKDALAVSPGVLAVIASSWFFEEVVQHSAADPGAYHDFPVAVKETTAIGWICLPDHADWPGRVTPKPSVATAATSIFQPVAELAAKSRKMLALTYRAATTGPVTLAGEMAASEAGGLPVTVPLGRLPAAVRGRDALLRELGQTLARKPRRGGGTWVLAGMGGLGKSTAALAIAREAQALGWRVWWVTAADSASLTGGMLEVLHQLRAPESVIGPVREGGPLAAERAWSYLNAGHLRGRWLLIFDNADTPAVLAAFGVAGPADYAGWLRPDPSGMVIVTTRTKDPGVWGRGVNFRGLRPLDDVNAAEVLADLAPDVPDPGRSEARDLGHRLGGLPLALHLAGTCLASPFARWRTFADYRRALDSDGLPNALADLDDPAVHARDTIGRTWDLSLDALAADGKPQARPLLSLLSCYAPATMIPGELLRAELLSALLDQVARGAEDSRSKVSPGQGSSARAGLRSLADVGLLDTSGDRTHSPAVIVHPVVADVIRMRLLTTAKPELPLVGWAAVRLLEAAASPLKDQSPADWPAWRLITPHVMAVLDWLAPYLDTSALASLVTVCSQASSALRSAGNLAMAEKLANLGVSVAAPLGDDHQASLAVRHSLGKTMVALGHNVEAESLYRQVLVHQQANLGCDHPETLQTCHYLAWAIEYQGRYREAEKAYRQLLADCQRILGDLDSLTLTSRRHLAWLTAMHGNYYDAERQYQQLVADRQRAQGDEHPQTLNARQHLARVRGLLGHYGEAEEQFRQLVDDQRRIMGDDHPDTIDTGYRLARVITEQGRYAEAEGLYRQVLADRRRVQGDDHPATVVTWDNIARIAGLQGRYREAEELFTEVLTYRRRRIGEDHPHTLTTRHRLARVLADQGRCGEAEQLFRQVLADRTRVLGPDHPDSVATRSELAKITSATDFRG